MNISLEMIQKEFPDYETALYNGGKTQCITCFEMVDCTFFSGDPHTLYVTDQPESLPEIPISSDSNFLVVSDVFQIEEMPVPAATAGILHIHTSDIRQIIRRLHAFFVCHIRYALFADSLLNHLFHESGIQNMIDMAYPIFSNPIFVFDASFNLIAANWNAAAEDPLNTPLLQSRKLSDHEYQLLNKLNHIHEKIKKSDVPIQIHHQELGFDQLICQINTQKEMGHIVINAQNRPFTEEDHNMLILLKHALDQQMKKDEFVRKNKGFPYEYFLKDLLDERIIAGQNAQDNFKYIKKEFHGYFYLIVIEIARSTDTVNQPRIRNEFEKLFPNSKIIVYDGEMIILIQSDKKSSFSHKDYADAADICRKNGIFAGISNNFDDIFQMKDYYKQALRAIELGVSDNPNPNLFLYSDYYMQHITQLFLQKEQASVFCHPKLEYIIQYDKKKHTEYAYTLYMFLLYERNSILTAEAMNIHPNTLRYRIKKLTELIELDLDNAQERQYLMMSYEVYKNRQ